MGQTGIGSVWMVKDPCITGEERLNAKIDMLLLLGCGFGVPG